VCFLIELLQHEIEAFGKMMTRGKPWSALNVSGGGGSFRYCGEITGNSLPYDDAVK
jgi:hypothetical protein